MRKIEKIIVHCSATKPAQVVTVDTIRRWHLARGFSDIGYHYVIYQDGTVHKGRPDYVQGAHVSGQNARSIGVCYIGGLNQQTGKPEDTRTDAQRAAMLGLLVELKQKYPGAKIYGHRDFANKACPCFDAKTEYAEL